MSATTMSSESFTKIPNDLINSMMGHVNTRFAVWMAIVRSTLGFHSQTVVISTRQLAVITGKHRQHITEALRYWEREGVISRVISKASKGQIITLLSPVENTSKGGDETCSTEQVRRNETCDERGTKLVPHIIIKERKERERREGASPDPSTPLSPFASLKNTEHDTKSPNRPVTQVTQETNPPVSKSPDTSGDQSPNHQAPCPPPIANQPVTLEYVIDQPRHVLKGKAAKPRMVLAVDDDERVDNVEGTRPGQSRMDEMCEALGVDQRRMHYVHTQLRRYMLTFPLPVLEAAFRKATPLVDPKYATARMCRELTALSWRLTRPPRKPAPAPDYSPPTYVTSVDLILAVAWRDDITKEEAIARCVNGKVTLPSADHPLVLRALAERLEEASPPIPQSPDTPAPQETDTPVTFDLATGLSGLKVLP